MSLTKSANGDYGEFINIKSKEDTNVKKDISDQPILDLKLNFDCNIINNNKNPIEHIELDQNIASPMIILDNKCKSTSNEDEKIILQMNG